MSIHQHARTTSRSREALVQGVTRGAESRRDMAEALGVSERTVRQWVQRYRTEGRAGLQDRSCQPRRQPSARRVLMPRMVKTGSGIATVSRPCSRAARRRPRAPRDGLLALLGAVEGANPRAGDDAEARVS